MFIHNKLHENTRQVKIGFNKQMTDSNVLAGAAESEMQPVTIEKGESPLVLGQPHSGTYVPADIKADLNPLGQQFLDTDWHIPKLYDGLVDDVTVVTANFSRYVIDANRNPSGESLYPGQNTTELVPTKTFDDKPIWNNAPDEAEINRRLEAFHKPYHGALWDELKRVRDIHGFAILYDCHSIRSELPYLFAGQLPQFNIGTNEGVTCSSIVLEKVRDACEAATEYSSVVNGRFKGGWTTREYGRPDDSIHAIQMELTQIGYLETETPPFLYDTEKAERLRKVLKNILISLSSLRGLA